ncbi:MAG TPA: type 1 glutamine amidotransferase [Candidatus Baltobacteraceae bacterium]|nr:type 1 glutamine amidotransferase [Candidatus Baltobacteraceae bacterium]
MTILHFQCLKDAPDRPVEIQAMHDGLGLPEGRLKIVRPFVESATPALLDGISGITIGGAGWSAFDEIPHYEAFLEVLREARRRRIPTLGICFGAQTLAHLYGGTVELDDPRAEYGTIEVACEAAAQDDPLFSKMLARFLAQSWHHDRITKLPSDARPLAWSQDGAVLQAFVFEGDPVWGVQFHPERTSETFGRLLETRSAPSDAWPIGRIRATLKPSPTATSLLARFAELCGEPR